MFEFNRFYMLKELKQQQKWPNNEFFVFLGSIYNAL